MKLSKEEAEKIQEVVERIVSERERIRKSNNSFDEKTFLRASLFNIAYYDLLHIINQGVEE